MTTKQKAEAIVDKWWVQYFPKVEEFLPRYAEYTSLVEAIEQALSNQEKEIFELRSQVASSISPCFSARVES